MGSEVPENSVAAVEMARRYGYTAIECDVHYTKDSVMVLMHDYKNMKRCIRRKSDNGSVGNLKLSDITFSDLRENYVLASDNPQYRTPVPTLEELLIACKENGIIPLLHSDVIESYHMAQQMFGNNWIAFSSNESAMKEARRISDCLVLLSFDQVTAEEAISRLRSIGGRVGISSMNYGMYTHEFCQAIRKAGFEVQSSIFPTPHEAESIRNGASILLSDFSYLPNKQRKPAKVHKIRKTEMPVGETLSLGEEDVHEYGACVLQITFEGTIEVTLNGERSYTFHRDEKGTDYVGMRYFRKHPNIHIKSKDNAILYKGKALLYEF